MDSASIAIALIATITAAYAVWVAILVTRAPLYSKGQKAAQIALVFLVPLVGPVIVHAVLRTQSAPPSTPDRNFVPNRTQDPDNAFAGGKYLDGAD